MKLALQKIWLFIKSHWPMLLLAIGAGVMFFINRAEASKLMELLASQRQTYKDEVDKIVKANQDEIKKRDEAIKRYQDTISNVEAQYQAQKLELDATKRKEIERIIKDSNNNPADLASQLSTATGFRVILPTE